LGACVFCRIVAGQGPARLLLSNDHTLAFLSIAPATPGHTLVVPRRHADDIWDLDDDDFHLHVVPRYHPDELQIMWQADPAPDQVLDAMHRRLLAHR
jgi:histidine triad (HIT) family protein